MASQNPTSSPNADSITSVPTITSLIIHPDISPILKISPSIPIKLFDFRSWYDLKSTLDYFAQYPTYKKSYSLGIVENIVPLQILPPETKPSSSSLQKYIPSVAPK